MIILIITLIAIIFYKIWCFNKYWRYVNKIPGPAAYPLFGSIPPIVFSAEQIFAEDRKRAKEFYPINKLWFLNDYFISIMSPEDIEIVLNNSVHNNKSWIYNFLHGWLGTGLLTSNGTKWHARRKLLTPAFHFSILQSFVDIFNKESNCLVEYLLQNCHKDYIDIVNPITEYTLNSIGETSLGISLRVKESSSYKEAIYKFGDEVSFRIGKPFLYNNLPYYFTKSYKKLSECIKILHQFSRRIILERHNQIKKSNNFFSKQKKILLDLLLQVGLDDEGIREEIDTFVFEGHDTTSMALCYILINLANEPKHQETVYEEIISTLGLTKADPTYEDLVNMKFLEMCIKESLRLYPSVPFISRVTGEKIITNSGYTIPKNSVVNIYIYDLHHSPQVWEDPEKFDPYRFLPDNIARRHPFAYVPFSAGSRNCIGQKYAMLELKSVICSILRNFKLIPVTKREDLIFKADLVLRPTVNLKIKFVRRSK